MFGYAETKLGCKNCGNSHRLVGNKPPKFCCECGTKLVMVDNGGVWMVYEYYEGEMHNLKLLETRDLAVEYQKANPQYNEEITQIPIIGEVKSVPLA